MAAHAPHVVPGRKLSTPAGQTTHNDELLFVGCITHGHAITQLAGPGGHFHRLNGGTSLMWPPLTVWRRLLRSDCSREVGLSQQQQDYMQCLCRRKGQAGKVSARVPTSGGKKEQLSCVDSRGASAAVAHESAVGMIELLAKQLTGSPALSQNGTVPPNECHMFRTLMFTPPCSTMMFIIAGRPPKETIADGPKLDAHKPTTQCQASTRAVSGNVTVMVHVTP